MELQRPGQNIHNSIWEGTDNRQGVESVEDCANVRQCLPRFVPECGEGSGSGWQHAEMCGRIATDPPGIEKNARMPPSIAKMGMPYEDCDHVNCGKRDGRREGPGRLQKATRDVVGAVVRV